MANRHGTVLLCICFALVISMQLHLAFAASSPLLNIASNPASYGQNDKISATATVPNDKIIIYINRTVVAGPRTNSVNFTICNNGVCLLPGTYAVTAVDNTTGTSTVQNLVVNPTYPTVSVQHATVTYGSSDLITSYPAFYNDSTSIEISRSTVASGHDSISYYVCGSGSNSNSCLAPGTYNVSVFDRTEKVYSKDNKTIVVTPILPTISLQYGNVNYGSTDKITATAPTPTDSISILLNSSSVATGTGTVTYTICQSPTRQPCIPPRTYTVIARDNSERINSSPATLTINPASIQLNIASRQVAYGSQDTIRATAPIKNDTIEIYIDGSKVASGIGKVSYAICSAINGTGCLEAGIHNITAYDTVAKSYANPQVLTVTPVPPSTYISSPRSILGSPITVIGSAPFYSDKISILLNGVRISNGTGNINYTICNYPQSPSCLSLGNYSVSIDDSSEGVNSILHTIFVISGTSSATTTIQTGHTTTIPPSNPTSVATTVPSKPSSSATPIYAYVAVVVIIVVIAVLFVLLKAKSKPAIE